MVQNDELPIVVSISSFLTGFSTEFSTDIVKNSSTSLFVNTFPVSAQLRKRKKRSDCRLIDISFQFKLGIIFSNNL